jgi:hypothetical protein
MKRIFGNGRYANVTATVAVVLAMGGTGYAATKLAPDSVTSKTVKDGSLRSRDFKAGQLPAGERGAAGQAGAAGAPGTPGAQGGHGDQGAPGPSGGQGVPGPRGLPGIQGLTGSQGAEGPQGPVGPGGGAPGPPGPAGPGGGAPPAVFQRAEGPVAGSAGEQTIQTMSLPAGNWVIAHKSVAVNTGPDATLRCQLVLGATTIIDSLGNDGFEFGTGTNNTTLLGAGTLAADGTVSVVCNTNALVDTWSYRGLSMTATQAVSLTAG